MTDELDRAEEYREIALAAAIDAARGIKPQPSRTCRECGDHLLAHRQEYGTCWACQSRIEARLHRGAM
jgi:hypothetical protein